MIRLTRKDADECAEELARVIGKDFGDCLEKVGDKFEWKVGCWETDYSPTYGGILIREVLNKAHGIRPVFGEHRRRFSDFCDTTRFAITAIDEFAKMRKIAL